MKVIYVHEDGSRIVEEMENFPEYEKTIDGVVRKIPVPKIFEIDWSKICKHLSIVLCDISAHAKIMQLDSCTESLKSLGGGNKRF